MFWIALFVYNCDEIQSPRICLLSPGLTNLRNSHHTPSFPSPTYNTELYMNDPRQMEIKMLDL
jgi:hypothetical protein